MRVFDDLATVRAGCPPFRKPYGPFLYFPQDRKNQDNEQHQAESTERIVAPSRTVTPTWKGSDQEKNKDDEKDIAHG
jgi:hypothetical protein